jgi:FlaG/FlaF family flagellin (archaellin)
MRRNMIAIAVTTAAAFFGVVLGSQPAAAAPAGKVVITVKAADAAPRTATLTCAPVGGTHTSAAEACAVLTAAGGNPARITPADVMCTMEYAPVKVKVLGRWNGKTVRYSETFSNNCRTSAEGGALFQF